MLMGAAAFGGRHRGRATSAAFGGLAPDAPSFGLVLWAGLADRRDPGEIFGVLYFSPEWQAIMAPSHSVPLWGLALAAALLLKRPVAAAFAASGLLHQAFDFLLHAEDAHRHFWPLTDWRFSSPVSYWDPAHFGGVVAPTEALLGLALVAAMIRLHSGRWLRGGLAVLGVAYLAAFVAALLLLTR